MVVKIDKNPELVRQMQGRRRLHQKVITSYARRTRSMKSAAMARKYNLTKPKSLEIYLLQVRLQIGNGLGKNRHVKDEGVGF